MMLLLMSATKVRKRALRCFTASVRQSCKATQAQTSAWPCISTVVPFAARYKDPSYVSSHCALYKPRCLELMTVVDAPESSNHQLPSSSFTYISESKGRKNGKNCVNCWSWETVSSTFRNVETLVRTSSTRTLTGDTKPSEALSDGNDSPPINPQWQPNMSHRGNRSLIRSSCNLCWCHARENSALRCAHSSHPQNILLQLPSGKCKTETDMQDNVPHSVSSCVSTESDTLESSRNKPSLKIWSTWWKHVKNQWA